MSDGRDRPGPQDDALLRAQQGLPPRLPRAEAERIVQALLDHPDLAAVLFNAMAPLIRKDSVHDSAHRST